MKIEGFFQTIKQANEAVDALKSAGYANAAVDMKDDYIYDFNARQNVPWTASSTGSLSDLVLEGGESEYNRENGPLAAANPMVSGMGTFNEIADVGSRLVVEVVELEEANKVKKIIQEQGGILDNPNVKLPMGWENVNVDDINIKGMSRINKG